MITQNSESASFTGLLKSLLALWVLEETRQTWPMFSESKASDSLRKIPSYRFSVWGKNDKSELGIFTSKHDSTCNKKSRVIVFMYRAKNHNSQLGIHLRMNSEFSENSELSLCPPPPPPPDKPWAQLGGRKTLLPGQ